MNRYKVRIGEAAKILGVTIKTVRNWERSGKLSAERSQGRHRYYDLWELQRFVLDIKALGWAWASSGQPPEVPDEYYCERQDRFTTRLTKMSIALLADKELTEDLVSLITLVVGEIGDNSFAHNVGNWPDVQGIFYAYDVSKRIIVLADRGLGVRATLRYVRPDLATDMDALRVAFTEIVSGRNPEKRGNGLKVVREVAESSAIALLYRSGLSEVTISKDRTLLRVVMTDRNVRGTHAVILY